MLSHLKIFFAKKWAARTYKKVLLQSQNAEIDQEKWFKEIVAKARETGFGKDHGFDKISTIKDFQQLVPIRDYEQLKPYIDRMIAGEKDVLWPTPTLYFAKSSGTTSGVKYIPITSDGISNHIHSARTALLLYIHYSNPSFINGKMIFLSGSPELDKKGSILTGRLSGIVNHHIPSYLHSNQLPTWDTNLIEDWEQKVDAIVKETKDQNMTLISGIPPWMIMYFEKLIAEKNASTVLDIFQKLQVIIYGGVNFEPYKATLQKLLGKPIDTVETYPASEGFIAFEAKGIGHEEGLLLNTDSGIFFEFIPVEEVHLDQPTRLHLAQIELNKNYALIINSNAGLWGYSIGDTIKFVSKNPYLIKVTGRIKHFISAFGEHVIAEEVDTALQYATTELSSRVREYHVAPQVNPAEGLPYHEWFIEFEQQPEDMEKFKAMLDSKLCELNIYYKDLIDGKILQPCQITIVELDGFKNYMQKNGKLGGQNKLPRLMNDRSLADELYIK